MRGVKSEGRDITNEEIKELRQLVKAAHSSGETSADWNGERLKACIIAGRKFAEIKGRLRHGKWLTWLEASGFGISRNTAGRWMKLAAFIEHNQPIESSKSIRRAYLLAGIIPDSDGSGARTTEEKPLHMLHALRLCSVLNRLDVFSIPDGEAEVLLQMLAKVQKQVEETQTRLTRRLGKAQEKPLRSPLAKRK